MAHYLPCPERLAVKTVVTEQRGLVIICKYLQTNGKGFSVGEQWAMVTGDPG